MGKKKRHQIESKAKGFLPNFVHDARLEFHQLHRQRAAELVGGETVVREERIADGFEILS